MTTIQNIPTTQIQPGNNDRTKFDQAAPQDLAASIEAHGLTQGKRTFWTRMADNVYIVGRHGPLWWRLWCRVTLFVWALNHVQHQWFNGRYWIDRAI